MFKILGYYILNIVELIFLSKSMRIKAFSIRNFLTTGQASKMIKDKKKRGRIRASYTRPFNVEIIRNNIFVF